MITNTSITVYHKGIDNTTRLETWTKFNYENAWFFGGKGAGINKGYENANDFTCRIPYGANASLDIGNFAIGDIVVYGTLTANIESQQDLEGYTFFNITSINNDNFGKNPHIRLGGK